MNDVRRTFVEELGLALLLGLKAGACGNHKIVIMSQRSSRTNQNILDLVEIIITKS